MALKDLLREVLTDEELGQVITSFDIVGDIAIIKVPEELEHRKHVIAEAVTTQHPNIRTVLRKTGKREGAERVAEYERLIGSSTETVHTEHGCRFRLDPTTVYFSERLGHERQRIVEQAQEGEVVIDMFAGIGPFTVLLAKKTDAQVHACELNPGAVSYLRQNVRLNKVAERVTVYAGDVRETLSELDVVADRVLMNLPKQSNEFIDLALAHVRPGGIIHYYTFVPKDELWDSAETSVQALFEDEGATVDIVGREICGHYNPAVERVCFDVRVQEPA